MVCKIIPKWKVAHTIYLCFFTNASFSKHEYTTYKNILKKPDCIYKTVSKSPFTTHLAGEKRIIYTFQTILSKIYMTCV